MGPGGGVMPVIHERPATGEANELLAFERALFWLRLVAGAVIVVLAAGAHQVPLPLVAVAVAIEIGAALTQRVTLRDGLALGPPRRAVAGGHPPAGGAPAGRRHDRRLRDRDRVRRRGRLDGLCLLSA